MLKNKKKTFRDILSKEVISSFTDDLIANRVDSLRTRCLEIAKDCLIVVHGEKKYEMLYELLGKVYDEYVDIQLKELLSKYQEEFPNGLDNNKEDIEHFVYYSLHFDYQTCTLIFLDSLVDTIIEHKENVK